MSDDDLQLSPADNINIDTENLFFPRIGFKRLQPSSTNELPVEQESSFWIACDRSSMNKHEIARYRWLEAGRRIIEVHRSRKREVIRSIAEAPAYTRKLEGLEVAYELTAENAHKALVRVLKFSPDGRSLVTARFVMALFV